MYLSGMKKHCITPVEWLGDTWRLLLGAASRKHDPFLVFSMASFNFGGGVEELLVRTSLQTT
jgi:hypothetical protein